MAKEALNIIVLVLVIIGAVNWGLVGAANWNLVEAILGMGIITNIIYVLVGVSGLYLISMLKNIP